MNDLFSYSSAAFGGVCIGIAASWLYLSIGRIAGISGIAARAIKGTGWPLLFIIGLGIGGWAATWLTSAQLPQPSDLPSLSQPAPIEQGIHWTSLIVGGVLVGFGTRLGSGCTSGHGVCGIARFSTRSITATCVFLGTGMLVATTISALGL